MTGRGDGEAGAAGGPARHVPVLLGEVRDALAAERDTVGFVTREEGPPSELRIRVSNPEGVARAIEIVRSLAQPVTSLTGGGASDIEATANGDVITVTLSEAERAEGGIVRLPADLLEAIRALENSQFVRGALGDDLYGAFLAVRRHEWETYGVAPESDVVAEHRWRYG